MGTPRRRRPIHHGDPTTEHPSQRGSRVAAIGTAASTAALAGAALVRQTTSLDLDVTTAVVAVGTVMLAVAVAVASFWQGTRRWNC